MPLWKDDADLFASARRELYTAVVGDIMDQMGYFHQFLPPQVRPLHPDMVTIGRAMTVLEADCFEHVSTGAGSGVVAQPFGLMLRALDDLKANEIYICTGASPRYALWGELMSCRAMQCGAVGAIVDGYHRDTRGILKLNFPTFSYGCYAQDQGPRGKVIDFRCPLELSGTRVNSGDILFGDIDGVCVVPKAIEEEVFSRAIEKARGEKTVLKALQQGMTATEAFRKYGIM